MRALRPQDVFWLREAQSSGESLEIEDGVLVGRSALRQALSTLWPLPGNPVAALVGAPEDNCPGGALVLARRRANASEADLVFIAPGLEKGNGVSLTWSRLVPEACQWLARRGVERVYVAVDEDDRLALQLLRQLGFVVYTNDVVFRADASTATGAETAVPSGGAEMRIAALQGAVAFAARQLAQGSLPESAGRHLPAPGGDWDGYPLGGTRGTGHALLDGTGTVVGAWRVVPGRGGTWLRFVVGPEARDAALVAIAVAITREAVGRQDTVLYATARGYEPELNLELRDAGFEAVARRFRLVKHTAVRVLAPAWSGAELREAGLEAHTTSARFAAGHRSRESGS